MEYITCYLDDRTLERARCHALDKNLINKCDKSKKSLEKEDCLYHRNLQTQVYSVSGYNNKDIRKINNQIIHYGDKPSQQMIDFAQFKNRLIDDHKL